MAKPTFRATGFTLIELMIVVAIIGILAMVAIPSFTKYIRRAKTVEASMMIRRLYDSSISYYLTERAARSVTAGILARQFPATVPLLPPADQEKCCQQPGGKCPPAPAVVRGWMATYPTDTWDALNFALSDPFYFHYQYSSTGTERAAMFTTGAYGDLDCNGEWSTYERTGSVDDHYNPVGGPGLYIHNDIE